MRWAWVHRRAWTGPRPPGLAPKTSWGRSGQPRVNVRRSAERLAALQPDAAAEARIPLQQRLERIDGAIADKVADAVATPAPYLTTALGPRPTEATQRQRWNEAARTLETWRHAELGLEPIDGPLADHGTGGGRRSASH